MRISRLTRILPWIFLLYTLHITLYTGAALCASKGADPVAYWRFDEGGGGTAYDKAGSNNGTLNAGAGGINTAVGQMWTRQGKIGGALECDGTDDWLNCGNNSVFDITSEITIQGWFYLASDPNTDANNNYRQMVGKGGYSPWGLLLEENRALSGSVYIAGVRQKTDTSYLMPTGEWVHVTYTYVGSTGNARIYVNGVLKTEQTKTTGTFNTSAGNVGISAIQQTYGWPGYIDDVRIYNYARTADQILVDYNASSAAYLGAGTDPNEGNPPVGYWKFDENTGATAYDRSGNGNNGAITNAIWTSGKYGSALNFDENGDYVDLGTNNALSNSIADITITAWVKLEAELGSFSDNYEVLSNESYQNNGYLFRVENTTSTSTAGKIHFRFSQAAANTSITAPSNSYPNDHVWHHLVAVKSNATGTIYLDGKNIYSAGGLSNPVNATGSTRIGGNGQLWNGKLDDVKIYNYARTQAQIAYDYNKGKPVAYYKFDEGGGAIAHNDYSSADTGAAPVGWWRMDEGTGTTTADASGNVNTGTLNPGTLGTNTTAVLMWDQTGKIGPDCLEFDGTDDHVSIVDSSSFSFPNVSFTVGAWVNPSVSPDDYDAVIGKWNNQAPATKEWLFRFGVGDTVEFRLIDSTNTGIGRSTTITVPTGQWTHILGTYDGTTANSNGVKIYINGVRADTTNIGTSFNGMSDTTSKLFLGMVENTVSGNESSFNGLIDDVRIYNYARTTEQIYNDYKTTHGTLMGGTKFVDGKIGKALQFDGTGDDVDCGNDASFNITDAITVEAWFKATALDRYQRIVSKQYQTDTTTANSCYQLGVDSGNKFRWSIGGLFDYSLPSPLVSQDTWYHFVGTYDRTYAKMYINGQELWSSTSYTGAIRSNVNEPLTIGISKLGGSADYSWQGLLDDVRIYNYSRTANQVLQDYNTGMSSHAGASTGVADPWGGAMPVGHWKLDENTGVLAKDASGNGNNGTLTNGPTWAQGKNGSALNFDGNNDYVDCGDNASLSPTNATWEMWIKPNALSLANSLGREQDFFSKQGGVNNYGWSFYNPNASNNLSFTLNIATTWRTIALSSASIGTWYHLAATYDGSYIRGYVNGAAVTPLSASGAISYAGTPSVKIGSFGTGTYCTNAVIDDVRIYNYVRTPAQITWDYNKGKPAGYWRFDEKAAGQAVDTAAGAIKDDSGNNNGTASNTAWAAYVTGKFGRCLSFDGTDDVVTVANFGTKIPAQEITVAAWIKPGVASGNDDLICTDPFEPGGGSNRFNIHFPWDTTILWQFGKPFTGTSVALDPSWVGVWGHYTFVASVSGNFYKIYRNGVQVATAGGVTAYDPSTQATLRIGGRAGNPFQGMIDDLRIYNYARTADQVMQDYNQGLAAKMGE